MSAVIVSSNTLEDLPSEPASLAEGIENRQRAIENGHRFYVGPACTHGHGGRRYTEPKLKAQTGPCVECKRKRQNARHADAPELTVERARELLRYEGNVDGCLYWKQDHGNSKAGDKAGWLVNKGKRAYVQLGIDGREYWAHRVAFLLVEGRWPSEIDHISGVGQDNRWNNLREVTSEENKRNASRYSNNTSGHRGVCWHKAGGKWRAGVRVHGKTLHLGFFNEFEDAVAARREAEQQYGFHENHGRDGDAAELAYMLSDDEVLAKSS